MSHDHDVIVNWRPCKGRFNSWGFKWMDVNILCIWSG